MTVNEHIKIYYVNRSKCYQEYLDTVAFKAKKN